MPRGFKSEDREPDPSPAEEVMVVTETQLAILCEFADGTGQAWVPKSVLHPNCEVVGKDDVGLLVVQQWWLDKNGWGDDRHPPEKKAAKKGTALGVSDLSKVQKLLQDKGIVSVFFGRDIVAVDYRLATGQAVRTLKRPDLVQAVRAVDEERRS